VYDEKLQYVLCLEKVQSMLKLFGHEKSWKLLAAEQNLSHNMVNSALKKFSNDVLRQFPKMDINLSSVLFDIYNNSNSKIFKRKYILFKKMYFIREH